MRKVRTIATVTMDEESRLRPIAAAANVVTGNRPSPPTIWRWKHQGCKGIPLPFTQVGGVAMISPQDFRKWLNDVTAASIKRAQNAQSPAKLSARQREAAERLAKETGQEVLKS